jgi:hypothetical protein
LPTTPPPIIALPALPAGLMATVEAAHGGADAAAAKSSAAARAGRPVLVDGRAVDQVVAYVLMAAALAVTYLVH